MKKSQYIMLPTILLAILLIFAACGRRNNSEETRRHHGQQQVLSEKDNVTDSPTPSPVPQAAPFLVRLENTTLTLYDATGEEITVIKSINIDSSYYPHDDISALNRGIGAYSKEEGFEMMENFTN